MDIGPEDTNPVDIEPELTHPAFVHHPPLNKYQLFSIAIADMLYSLSHHGLLIDKNYSINYPTHLQYFVSTNTLPTGGL